jgi:hypothetical protein
MEKRRENLLLQKPEMFSKMLVGKRMNEFIYRERILATLKKKCPDKVPFFHHWRRLQTGHPERIARNRCMGVWWERPCYIQSMPDVDIIKRSGPSSGSGANLVE